MRLLRPIAAAKLNWWALVGGQRNVREPIECTAPYAASSTPNRVLPVDGKANWRCCLPLLSDSAATLTLQVYNRCRGGEVSGGCFLASSVWQWQAVRGPAGFAAAAAS